MDEIALTDELKADFINYIVYIDDHVGSINTIKSYGNVITRIFKNYNTLNRETSGEMLKRYGKTTKIRAVLAKMNEYFYHKDIMFTIRLPKSKRSGKRIPEIVTREELQEVISEIPDVGQLIISCIFNIGAGLRISELINLRWENISWSEWSTENKTLDVRIVNSKGKKDRVIPIPHFTTAELYDYCKRIGHLDNDGFPKKGRIFDFGVQSFKQELKLLEPELWEHEYKTHAYDFIRHNIINKYFKKFKNKKITAHSLRHSRATELHDKFGVPIEKLQEWLGHSDISTTMIYLHLSTSKDKEIMEKAGGI